jgi:hypothetical protein
MTHGLQIAISLGPVSAFNVPQSRLKPHSTHARSPLNMSPLPSNPHSIPVRTPPHPPSVDYIENHKRF